MIRTCTRVLFGALLFAVLQGCSGANSFSDYVESVVTASTDNSLRVEVRMSFRKDCSYFIEYWKTSESSNVMRSERLEASAGKESVYTVKFLYPQTEYAYKIVAEDGLESQTQIFKTGTLPPDIPQYTVETPGTMPVEGANGYIMQWEGGNPGYVTFCDIDGNVVWYHAYGKAIRTAWYDPRTRQIAILMGFKSGDDTLASDPFYRLASDILVSDLDGNLVFSRKSSASYIEYPHHEFKILDDGRYLILHNVVKDGIYGEGFTVLTPEGEVRWTWNSFAEVNPSNTDYVNAEKFAKDYIHANSVAQDADGNFYFTVNRLSELWKIDGVTGDVLYRLGVHGNVNLTNGDFPTGGLHAAEVLDTDRILCYDNGSNRGYSRGVIYKIDPATKTAVEELSITLPAELSSKNRSNAQMISDNLFLLSSTVSGKAVFTDRNGNILRIISRSGISYRGYWFSADKLRF